jgi:lysophospholipase L1-like esterase
MKSIYSSLVALVVFVGQVNSSTRHSIQRGHAMKSAMLSLSLKRREFLSKAAATLFVIATLAIGPVATANDDHWVASWATSPAAFFVYTAPVVQNQALAPAPARFATANIQPDLVFPFPDGSNRGATTQTLRSIVKPDLWGDKIRIRFSNVFGNQPLTFDAVTVGLQEYGANLVHGTNTRVTFRGSNEVTVPAGGEVWSDSVHLSWVRDADDPAVLGRNLAISYSIQGDSGHMTYHSGANQTSFITAPNSGDHTRDASGFAYVFTTTSWFFLTAVDVMGPADTVVICAFGDSITDGTHTTLNINDRWANVLSRRLHNAYGSKVSIVNEAIGGNRVVNPVVANATSGPAAVDRLDSDVLGLSGLTHVIWLEGINDLGAAHPTDDIVAGYKDVVGRLHAKGIKVYGATMTSALGFNNPSEGWDLINFPAFLATGDNGAPIDADRKMLNDFIRTSGLFDGVVDFDEATLDPATGNMKAEFLPNSQFTQLPWDYLHPNHAGYNAMGMAVDIRPFAPRGQR